MRPDLNKGANLPRPNNKNLTVKDLIPSLGQQQFQVDPTLRAGQSKYDIGASPENIQYLDESRAIQQSALDKVGNGLANATTSAFTSALEGTVGFAYGLTNFLVTGEVKDIHSNAFTNNILDPLSNWTRENMPFYYSQAEKDAPFYQGLVPFTEGAGNFWFDKVLNGAGYMFGSLVGGLGLSKVFKLGKAAALGGEELLSSSADDILKGYKTAALDNKRLDMSKQFSIGLALGHSEAALEARETYKSTIENFKKLRNQGVEGYANLTDSQIERMAEESANFNYGLNLAIVGPTDMLLLGKFINPGAKQSLRKYNKITESIEDGGALVLKDATLSNKYRGLLNGTESFMKGFGVEAFQEGAQFASNIASQEFVQSSVIEKQPWLDSVINGLTEGIAETINSKEGLESILIGGIIGGPAGWKGSRGERLAREEATKQLIEFRQQDSDYKGLSEKGKKFVESMDLANKAEVNLKQGDLFEAKNAEANAFRAYVQGYIEKDASEYLIERLNTLKQAPADEFKKQFGYGETEEVNQAEVIDKLTAEVKDLQELHDNINQVFGIHAGTPEELAFNKMLKNRLFTSSFNIKNIEKREKQIADELQKITGAGELLRLRSVAIKSGKFDEQAMETYAGILGDRTALEYDKFIEEYGNDYLKTYNAALKQFVKDYPVDATEVSGLLEDLNKLAERREQFIKYHNSLLNTETRDKVMEQELAAIFSKSQAVPPTSKLPTSSEEEVNEIFKDAPDARVNAAVDPSGTEINLAKTTADKLRELKQEALNKYQNLPPDSEEAAKLEQFLAAIDNELNIKQQREAQIQDLRNKFRNATTVEELTSIANKIKSLGVEIDQEKFAQAVQRVVTAQEKAKLNQELNTISQVINENFKGAREFTEVVFYKNSAEAARKIQDILNNPGNLNKVKVRLTKQSAQKKSAIGGINTPENPNLERLSPPIVIELVYEGVPVGFLSYYDMFIDKTTGKAINIQSPSFTLAEYKRLFQPDLNKAHTSFENFKQAHANLATLYQKLAEMLGTDNTTDVSAEEFNKLVGLKLSMGLFQPLEEAKSLESYDVYSKDGVKLIVDTAVKHQSSMTKQAVGPNEIPTITYETSFSDAYEPNMQDIAAGDKVDSKLQEAFQALSDIKNNPKSGRPGESRYWTLVAMPQGQVTIEGKSYSWIPVTPTAATPTDIKAALTYLGEQFANPPASAKGKGAVMSELRSMLYFAMGIDRNFNNNLEVTLMPGYEKKNILLRIKSEAFKSVNNGNPNVYIEVPYTQDPQEFLNSLEAERKKNALLTNLTPFTASTIKKSTPKNLYELGIKVNESFVAKVDKTKTNQHIILEFNPEEKKAGQPLSNAEKQARVDKMMGKAQGQSGALTNEEKQARVDRMMGKATAASTQPQPSAAPVSEFKTVEDIKKYFFDKNPGLFGNRLVDALRMTDWSMVSNTLAKDATDKELLMLDILNGRADISALQPATSVSDKKAIVAAGIREQGTQVSVEVIGDSGKEFLLVIDRNSKGRVELFSEKKDWGDGTFTYRPGEQASQEQKVKLYNKYVPESVRNLITEWQNSFTGSWAAPETEDGKRHRAIEEKLNKELAALEGAASTATEQLGNILNTPVPDNVKKEVDNAGLEKEDKSDELTKGPKDDFVLKRVPTTVLTEEEKIDVDKAKAWLKTVLPAGIDIALVDTIVNNVMEGHTTMGQFINACVVLSKQARKGTERHEAFHAIFRTCLTNEQQDYYYKAAERDMAKEFTAKGKSVNKAFREFLEKTPEIADASPIVQKHLFLEEYMADKYETYTPKAKPESLIEKLFNTFKKVVKFFSGEDVSTELGTLFDRIDRGVYASKGKVSNRFDTAAYKIAANQRVYTGHNKITGTATYLPTADQIKEVNYLTAEVIKKIQAEVSNNEDLDNLTLEEILDQILNERLDYFDPAGAKWQSLIQTNDPFAVSKLYDFHFIYKLKQDEQTGEWGDSYSRKQLREEVLSNLNKYGIDDNLQILNESETDDGSSPERNFNDNQENQGGFGSLSRALKRHIATTTHEVSLNEFFNTDVFRPDQTITLAVDPKQVYDGLTRACQNEPDPIRLLEKMAAMQENSSEVATYVGRLFRETGVQVNIDGSVDISTVHEKDRNDLLRAVKGFNLYSLDYLFTSIDPTGQLSQTILANTRDVDKIQVERWSQLFRTKSKDLKPQQRAALSTLKTFATTGTNKIPNPEGGVDFVIPDDRLNEVTVAAQNALRDYLGIKLSKGIIKYLMLNNPKLIKSDAQQKFLELYADQIKYSHTEFIEFLDVLNSIIEKGDNPFVRKIDPDTKEEIGGGMVTRLEKLAKVNAVLDETVEQPSFINGEGKTVYAFQHGTYNILKGLELANPSKTNVERLTELAETNPSLRFVLDNFLLTSPEFLAIQPKLHIKRIDAIRERKLVMQEDEIKIDTQNRVTEGIVYGDMSNREFLLTLYALYANTKTDMVVNGKVIPARDVLITVMEASNTADAVTLPIVQAVNTDGTINADYIAKRVAVIKNEHARIVRVKAGEFTTDIQEFNTGSKRRGEKFWADNALILNTILADESINTEGVTLQELENAESLDNYNDMLTKGMEMYLQRAIDRHILKLAEAGIISINEKKELQNNFLPKGFATQLKPEDPNYIFPTGNLRANIAQVYLSNELNTIAINELMYGDPALGLKDFQDKFKRDRGANASGMNTITLDWENNTTKNEFKYIVFGDQPSKDSKLSDPSVKNHTLTPKGTVLKIRDAQGQLTQEFLDYAKDNKLSDEEVDELAKGNKSIDIADAQGFGTVTLFRDIYESLGRMTPRAYKIYAQIEKGEQVNEEDWQYLQDNDIMLNSLKMVYYDGTTYLKLSITHLSKQMTSYYDKASNTWKPRKGQEWQHDLREKMETSGVQLAGPPSMSKKMIVNPVALQSDGRVGNIEDRNVATGSRQFFRLQQENPSNKLKIKDPTQMLQILATEQKDDTPIIFEANPDIKTIGQLKEFYAKTLGTRVMNEFYNINSFISDLKQGKSVPNLKRFIKVFGKTLRETGASDKLLDMLEVDSQGNPVYNFNLPDVARKFEEMFNAHFNKSLSLTIPGYKVTLQSGIGHEVIIEKKTGRIIPRYEYDANPAKYESEEYTTRPLEYNVPRKVKRKVTMTLPGLAPMETEEEVVVGSYAEVILPAHFRELFGLEPGDIIPEEIAYMFGVRIPSQDKHSALSLRVVDFLPAEYGSNAVFPHEIVLLTGSDFDIDSFYIHRPDHYIKYVDGKPKFMVYGNKEDSQIEQYIRWNLENNTLLKSEIQDSLKSNEALHKQVKNLATAKDFASKLIAENKDKITKIETSEYPNVREALAAGEEAKNLKKANRQLIAEYREVSEKIRKIKHELAIQTMKSLKLPTTEEELKKSGLQNIGALNNAILEAKMLLHDNPYVNKDINKTPASLDAIQNKGKTGVLDKLAQALGYEGYEDIGEPETTSSLSGMVKAFVSNKAGSKAIGAAVNSTQLYSVLSRFGIRRNAKMEIYFDGAKLNEISRNSFITKAGERIMDLLSTLTSSMTDNAKYGYNSKLNFDLSSLGVVSYGIMHGMDLQTMTFLLNQDAVLDYVQANKSYAIETIFESQGRYARVEAVKSALISKLQEADSSFNLDEFMKEPLNITLQDLTYALQGPNGTGMAKNSKRYTEANLDQRNSIDAFKNKDIRYLRTQLAAFLAYEEMEKNSNYLLNTIHPIKLTKGLTSSTDRSFNADDQLISALRKLNIEGYIDANGEVQLRYFNTSDAAMAGMTYDVLPILNSDPLIKQNLAVVLKKQLLSQQLFISKIPISQKLKNVIIENMPRVKKAVGSKILNNFRRNIESFLSITAFRKMLADKNVPNIPDLNDLLYGDLIEQINKFRKDNPKFNDNLFLNSLAMEKKPDGFVSIAYHTRGGGMKGFEDRIRNDADSLFNEPEGAKIINKLFFYCIAKDALQYKNNGIVSILPTHRFLAVSKQMDRIMELMQKDNVDTSQLFGMERTALEKEYIEMFYRDTNNYRGLKQIRLKNFKAPYIAQTATTIRFVSTGGTYETLSPEQEAANKKMYGQQMQLFEQEFGLEGKEVKYPLVMRVYDAATKTNVYYKLVKLDGKEDFKINDAGLILGKTAEYEATTRLGATNISIYGRNKQEAEALNEKLRAEEDTFGPAAMEEDATLDNALPSADQLQTTQALASSNKILEGDIFSLPGIPVITTNLGGVHGAGLAQAAKARGLVTQGDGAFKATDKVVQLPVKQKWSDSMSMNNNMGLLAQSLNQLIAVANSNPNNTYLLPLAGLGHGEGSVEQILPLLINTVKVADNIKLVLPAEGVNLGRQGTVRKDYTRENMPKIKKLLSQAGLLAAKGITTTEVSVEITKTNYTRQEVQNNPNTAYVFTENTHSITAFPNRQGGGSAIIRPEPNAFAIVTKKKYDYNTKENVDYTDTPEDFKEFTEVNIRLINELKNSGKSKIVFPQGFATDKAKMPTRFAEWLQKELLDNFGLVTELNATKTGLISKSTFTKPTTEDTVEAKVKEGFMMNKASGENAVNLQVQGDAASITSVAEKRKAVKDYLLQLEQAYTNAGNTAKANAAKAERTKLMLATDEQAMAMYKKYLC